jgi:hypothetical protein
MGHFSRCIHLIRREDWGSRPRTPRAVTGQPSLPMKIQPHCGSESEYFVCVDSPPKRRNSGVNLRRSAGETRQRQKYELRIKKCRERAQHCQNQASAAGRRGTAHFLNQAAERIDRVPQRLLDPSPHFQLREQTSNGHCAKGAAEDAGWSTVPLGRDS